MKPRKPTRQQKKELFEKSVRMACKALDAGMHLHQACKPMDGKRKHGFEEVKGGVPMFAIGIVSSLILVLYHLCKLWLLKSKNPRTGGNR